MHILVVTAGLPHPTSGANTRNYHLLKALASRHAVSLLALVDQTDTPSHGELLAQKELARPACIVPVAAPAKRLQQMMDLARGRSYFLNRSITREMQYALDTLCKRDHYDAILFESVFLAGYRIPQGVKVIIDQHNIEYELLQRTYSYEKASLRKWYSWLEGRLLKAGEIERCRRADALLVTSDREHLLLKQSMPQQVIRTIPNGVDLATFQPAAHGEGANQIVFTGTMDYYPNSDAVLSFAQRCWPLIREHVPNATWKIVGRNPPPEVCGLAALPGITVTGSVPDVRSHLAASALAIAPLQVGSGTRLKILEAFAMRKAVVSTSVGCEGLAVTSGEHLLIANQAEAFAHAIVDLLRDPVKRAQLGYAGRKLVEQEYSWKHSGDQLLRLLEEIF